MLLTPLARILNIITPRQNASPLVQREVCQFVSTSGVPGEIKFTSNGTVTTVEMVQS